jgi:hypothetical protein
MTVAGQAFGILGPAATQGAPETIQVYMDEMDAPGKVGLDLPNNYVLCGSSALENSGAQDPVHRHRLTPEFSYGLTPTVELAAYVPLLTLPEARHLSAEDI